MNDNEKKADIIQGFPKELREFLKDLGDRVSLALFELIQRADGAAKLLEELPKNFKPAELVANGIEGCPWDLFGCFFRQTGRSHEALRIFSALYRQLLAYQEKTKKRAEKSIPLIRMGLCHMSLNHPVHAKRYLMLTLCEEAIAHRGVVFSEGSGGYYHLVLRMGLSHAAIERYYEKIWALYKRDRQKCRFPEWCLQELDQDWMTELPHVSEAGLYEISTAYAKWLLDQTEDKAGRSLERLAQYLIRAMPGCRAIRRVKSQASDYDVVASFDGSFMDFRSELGRYLLVECKDWKKKADFTTIAKFCRILDSVKCRFGILFSRKGVSGAENTQFGQREIVKVFQDRGIVIVVVDKKDLEKVVSGANFLAMLCDKYEKVRLDLPPEAENAPSA